MLRGLRTQFRVIATPLPGAAVARDDTWQDLWGSVIVWIGGRGVGVAWSRTDRLGCGSAQRHGLRGWDAGYLRPAGGYWEGAYGGPTEGVVGNG